MSDPVLEKGTSGYGNVDHIKMWMPLVKDGEGGYMAVLTDDSMDREGEFMGKGALQDFVDNDYLAGLMDHDNKILNQVCEWTQRRMETIDGHNAVVAKARFFKSNPNAVILMGMLDEGARMGVSIGAIVKSHSTKEVNGKKHLEYTKVEPIEASFVAVPANKHAHAIAISKSLNPTKKTEVPMDKSYTQTEVDELTTTHTAKTLEVSKKLEEATKAFELEKAELAKKLEDAEKAFSTEKAELNAKIAAFEEKDNKATLMKGANVGTPTDATSEGQTETAVKDGKVLVMRR